MDGGKVDGRFGIVRMDFWTCRGEGGKVRWGILAWAGLALQRCVCVCVCVCVPGSDGSDCYLVELWAGACAVWW